MNRIAILVLLMLVVVPLTARYAAQPAKQQPNYADQLPRIPPKEPTQALATFALRSGFRIDLVASEPLVRSPVAMEFDENGRLFVVEFPEYNEYASKKPHGRGSVKLLEDTDGDGRYDRSTVYVDNLNSPVALACWDGGIFVGCVPDILYCKDTDGDGKADIRRTVFTGFRRDAAGEAMLNSFRWGFDNRFHISTSLGGGEIRNPAEKDSRPINVRGQGFLFDPRAGTFEVTSGGGQHGMSMDDWGRKFVCSNSEPAHLLHYDGRYVARNPYLAAPAAAVNIAPGGKNTQIFRISPNEPWRVLRTKLRSEKLVPGSDEGGKPSGFFTGATGITVYRGHAWPEEYRGNLFVGEVSGNLVYRARLEPNGVSLRALRAEEGVEFLASRDNWFRPVQFAHGPDGCLHVVDMYRELIEGAAFLPPQILAHLDPGSGSDRGRIYRIAPREFKYSKPPQLGKASTAELVALLEHPNGWHRDTASRLLYQRQDAAAIAPLRTLASKSRTPLGRLHALYALQGIKALTPTEVLTALSDPEPRLREHALRLAESFSTHPALVAQMEKLADDPTIGVRYQAAFSLGAISGESALRALVKLALRDGADPWFRLAILSSVHNRQGDLFRHLLTRKEFRATPAGRTLLNDLAVQVGAQGSKDALAVVVKAVDDLPAGEKPLSQTLVRSLVSKASPAVREQFTGAAGGKAGAILGDLMKDARRIAADSKQKPTDRAAAIRTLGLAPFDEVRDLLTQSLQLRQPQPVQLAALETLARFDHAEVAKVVLEAWPTFSPQLRATAAETLFARPAWTLAFLDAVEKGGIARGEVDPARIQLLQASSNTTIRDRSRKLFAGAGLSKRDDVVKAYRKALELKGDAARGKVVFKTHCSSCHRLEGVGTSVGADLAAIRDRGLESVLLNILDPNREVKPQFQSYILVTTRGRSITGLITAETAGSLTIRRVDGTTETILRIDIEELRSTGLSFMPEGLEKQIDVPAMADLLAYLNSIR